MANNETSFRISITQWIEQIRSQIKHFAELEQMVKIPVFNRPMRMRKY